jgi:hypothetical protein
MQNNNNAQKAQEEKENTVLTVDENRLVLVGMNRCNRCKFLGRIRSPERGNCCRECENISDAEAEIVKRRRMRLEIDIIGDCPTLSRCGIDALDSKWWLPSARSENSSYTLVSPTEAFGKVARSYGINTTIVDFWEDRNTVLSAEIDALSGNNLTVILFPGRSQTPAIERLMARAEEPVIVLAGDAARYWQELGVLTISADELPKQRRGDEQ